MYSIGMTATPTNSPVSSPVSTCSKCDKALDTTGYPLWCRSCRAANKREYENTRREMQESRGYAAGVTAMRHYLAENFRRYGTAGSFSGVEIAATIMQVRGPFDEDRPASSWRTAGRRRG